MSQQLDLFNTYRRIPGDGMRVWCFFDCGYYVTEGTPDEAHGHMEAHYEVQHRPDLERLHALGYIG